MISPYFHVYANYRLRTLPCGTVVPLVRWDCQKTRPAELIINLPFALIDYGKKRRVRIFVSSDLLSLSFIELWKNIINEFFKRTLSSTMVTSFGLAKEHRARGMRHTWMPASSFGSPY